MIRVKGTELYMLQSGLLEKIACVSAISGLSETMALRGRATLCEDENFESSGFPKFSTVNFTCRLSFDSTRLLVLQRNRTVVKLIVGFGDSTAQPVNYNGLTLPLGRTWIEVEGQFIGFDLGVPEASIVQTTVTFKVSSQMQIQPVVPLDRFPITLFMDGEKGFWADPSDASTLFQNADRTIAVVDGDPIGLVLDKSGNGYNLTQTVSASRPKLLNGGIAFDRVNDALTLTVPSGGITGTLFLATTRGTASYGVSMPAGVWALGNAYNPLGDVVSAVLVDRVLSEDEKSRLHVFGVGKGGTEFGAEVSLQNAYRDWTHLVEFPLIDTSNGTNFAQAWQNCSSLTSFPVLDVSRGTSFAYTWFACSGLTSFPELDVSSGTSFDRAWTSCSALESFPANFFNNCLATNFTNAFFNTKLSQASIDGILVSINSNSTSNGTFNQTGGSAPSIVGQAAIDAMRSRGWTVTVTGGY